MSIDLSLAEAEPIYQNARLALQTLSPAHGVAYWQRRRELGGAAWSIYQHTQSKSLSLLEECEQITKEFYDLILPTGRDVVCHRYAVVLFELSRHKKDSEYMQKAIIMGREALDLRPVGHAERYRTLSNLGVMLVRFYPWSGEKQLLDDAIQYHEEALKLWPSDSSERLISCSYLALALHHTNIPESFPRAISLAKEAVSKSLPDDLESDIYQTHLLVIESAYHVLCGRIDLLIQTVARTENELRVWTSRPELSPARIAIAQSNVAVQHYRIYLYEPLTRVPTGTRLIR